MPNDGGKREEGEEQREPRFIFNIGDDKFHAETAVKLGKGAFGVVHSIHAVGARGAKERDDLVVKTWSKVKKKKKSTENGEEEEEQKSDGSSDAPSNGFDVFVLRELALAMRLGLSPHANVVSGLAVARDSDPGTIPAALVMQNAGDCNLHELIERHRILYAEGSATPGLHEKREEMALRLLSDLSHAVDHVNTVGQVAHGDIKSGNVIVKRDGTGFALADFGSTIPLEHGDDGLVKPGEWVCGCTKPYRSPECILGADERGFWNGKGLPIGIWSDVWSIGMVVLGFLLLAIPVESDCDVSQLYSIFKRITGTPTKESLPEAFTGFLEGVHPKWPKPVSLHQNDELKKVARETTPGFALEEEPVTEAGRSVWSMLQSSFLVLDPRKRASPREAMALCAAAAAGMAQNAGLSKDVQRLLNLLLFGLEVFMMFSVALTVAMTMVKADSTLILVAVALVRAAWLLLEWLWRRTTWLFWHTSPEKRLAVADAVLAVAGVCMAAMIAYLVLAPLAARESPRPPPVAREHQEHSSGSGSSSGGGAEEAMCSKLEAWRVARESLSDDAWLAAVRDEYEPLQKLFSCHSDSTCSSFKPHWHAVALQLHPDKIGALGCERAGRHQRVATRLLQHANELAEAIKLRAQP